jgi:26S proteasome regulatory subunit N5
MELREKIEILLEQMRLLILVAKMKDDQAAAKGGLADGEADWVKMRVGGRKVNEGFLNKPDNQVRRMELYSGLRLIVCRYRTSNSSSMN